MTYFIHHFSFCAPLSITLCSSWNPIDNITPIPTQWQSAITIWWWQNTDLLQHTTSSLYTRTFMCACSIKHTSPAAASVAPDKQPTAPLSESSNKCLQSPSKNSRNVLPGCANNASKRSDSLHLHMALEQVAQSHNEVRRANYTVCFCRCANSKWRQAHNADCIRRAECLMRVRVAWACIVAEHMHKACTDWAFGTPLWHKSLSI